MNNLNFADFDKQAIIYGNNTIFIKAEAFRTFLQIAARTFSRSMAKLENIDSKVSRVIVTSSKKYHVWVLTVKGIRMILYQAKLTHISNREELIRQIEESIVNAENNIVNNDADITGVAKILDTTIVNTKIVVTNAINEAISKYNLSDEAILTTNVILTDEAVTVTAADNIYPTIGAEETTNSNTGCKMVDVNLSVGSCIYLILIKEGYYKLGETDDVRKRLQKHKSEFNYEKIIKVFPCSHKTASQNIERDIKQMLNLLGYMVPYPKKKNPNKFHQEVFKTDELVDLIVHKFTEIIKLYELHNPLAMLAYDRGIQDQKNQNKRIQVDNIILMEIVKNMKEELEEVANLKQVVSKLENQYNYLLHIKQTEADDINTIKHKRDLGLDIDLDTLSDFVKRSFTLSPTATASRKMLETRLMTTTYWPYFDNSISKHKFFIILYTCMESIFGKNPKHNPNGENNKDFIYGYCFAYASVEEFIKQKCDCSDDANNVVSENVDNFKILYSAYCAANNCFGYISELPAEMKRLGYTSKSISRGGKRHVGIYFKENNVQGFIQERCAVDDKYAYVSLKQLLVNYIHYCVNIGIDLQHIHDRSTVKHIFVKMGFKLVFFDNNCINIQGLSIIGEKYDRKKKLPVIMPTII